MTIHKGQWHNSVKAFLHQHGFQTTNHFRFTHPMLVCDFLQDDSEHLLGRVAHLLREIFRKGNFDTFLHSGRRDAAILRATQVQYVENRAKKASNRGSSVARWSSQSLCICNPKGPSSSHMLPRLQYMQAAPNWQHMFWECESRHLSRLGMPSDPLQARLGWPVHGCPRDRSILINTWQR